MNTKSFYASWKARNFSEMQCYAVLFFLLIPVSYCIIQFETGSGFMFHGLLFFTAFIVFTFFEYIAHRFWMHGKEESHPGKKPGTAYLSSQAPAELKITASMRNLLLLANFLLILFAVWLNNYFTLFSGFYSGFVYYCFIHLVLHKRWAKKVFPRMQVSHIHHHCKFPDRCFGTCLVWWDNLFNTSVSKEVKISGRILQFYFGSAGH